MIGYRIALKNLQAQIDTFDSKWRARAAAETKALKHGDKVEKSLWSDVKPVYMKLQNGKCAFCETLLGKQIEFDLINQDVEHFRPKNAVEAWPTQKLREKLKLPADLPASAYTSKGYTFLAYHVLNYASSCKKCNSTLKASYFPTLRAPKAKGRDPVTLTAAEEPYLLFPIGDFDDRPEEVITFIGVVPVPAHPRTKQPKHDRARVTIAFFGLSMRDDLIKERALRLDQLGDKFLLRKAAKKPAEIARLDLEIAALCSARLPHTSCVSAFRRLWEKKPDKSREMHQVVKNYLYSTSEKT